jgi:hypothetical protein
MNLSAFVLKLCDETHFTLCSESKTCFMPFGGGPANST